MTTSDRNPVVVMCEEQSDDGSLLKHFDVFRSGLVFGRNTNVRRSLSRQMQHDEDEDDVDDEDEYYGDRGDRMPVVEPPSVSAIQETTTAVTIAVAAARSAVEPVNQPSDAKKQPYSDDLEVAVPSVRMKEALSSEVSSSQQPTQASTEHVSTEEYSPRNNIGKNTEQVEKISTASETLTKDDNEEQEEVEERDQPLDIPILPFTLGPYPVPLGGLPKIQEETPSMCSELTKTSRKKLNLFARVNNSNALKPENSTNASSPTLEEDAASQSSTNASTKKHSVISALEMGTFEDKNPDNQDNSKGAASSSFYTRTGAPDSQFREYCIDVDPTQGDRGADIPLFSAARPHMRAFHFAWMSFFVAL